MRIFPALLFCLLFQYATAQETSPFTKFGKISVENLQKKIYTLDSNANAVVLSDIGEAAVEGNSKAAFSISFTHHRVVHILKKPGYSEADVEVVLYSDGSVEEKLESVKAVTYNLEGDKIVESKLDKSAIFKEKRSDHYFIKKFTFPNVKEGCIVEYEYKVTSDYIWNLDPWYFQGESPALWSEFKLSVPQFFTYAFLGHGYLPMTIQDRKNRQTNFTVSDSRGAGATDRASFTAGVTDYRWVMKDVPEFREESYTSSRTNHISRIDFQLASQSDPLPYHDYRSTWTGLTKELLESEYFGKALSKDNNWLGDDIKPLLTGATSDLEKAKRIYEYVRDNIVCTDHRGIEMNQTLKNVMKTKKGSVSEINLLLTAMLRYAGIYTSPVILSTTGHGYALELYPMINSFNYVVAKFTMDGKDYFLDASHPRLGFAKLMPECYNGHARVIDEAATAVTLSADSLKERKLTAVFITNDEKGKWVGTMNQTPGYYESDIIRDKLKEKGQEEFFKQVEKDFVSEVTIEDPHVDSLEKYDYPINMHYGFELNTEKAEMLYVNPMFGEGYKNNPFKSAERNYPVEMPYTFDETYLLTMEVPKGYVVDELPKQIVTKLDEEGSAYFEYRITQSGDMISLRTILRTSKTMFLPDEYEGLREFFNLVVKKQNEQIVFKKKK
jgi:hypothetical protein